MPEGGPLDSETGDGVDVDFDSDTSGPVEVPKAFAAASVAPALVSPTAQTQPVSPSTASGLKPVVTPGSSGSGVRAAASAPVAPSDNGMMPFASSPSSTSSLSELLHSPVAPLGAPAVIGGTPDLGLFGRYRLQQRLATGGMAQLYLASIDGPDGFSKQCVVKTILPEFAALPDFNEMFVTEAKVTAMLHHQNIVEIYDFGREQGRYYLAMEYVRGCSLHQLLREASRAKQVLGPRIAITIGSQMCEALSYAHSLRAPDGTHMNLVHRDLSAGNILISSTGLAKLTDFGIVKSDLNMNSTATGVVKGKYPYMSPEQIRGEPVDSRSDIFSLGTVLYEVATGLSLFKRKSLADTINAVARAEVRPPSEYVPNFPLQFEKIILKALALEREDRFQSFAEMAHALDVFRLSSNWTASTRELSAMVQTYFPGGEAVGSYRETTTGMIPNQEPAPRTAAPTQTKVVPEPSDSGSLFGPLELGLAALALALFAMVVWLVA